eukprot:747169-Hanusia_phi.AAC.3
MQLVAALRYGAQGNDKVIGFYSRLFTDAEQTHSEFSCLRQGADNIVPDALSRQYPDSSVASPHSDAILHEDDQDFPHLLGLETAAPPPDTVNASATLVQDIDQNIAQGYASYPYFSTIYAAVQEDHSYRHFHIDNKLLILTDSLHRQRICISQSLCKEIIYRSHDLHSNREFSRKYLALVSRVSWPAMRQQIERYVLSCLSPIQILPQASDGNCSQSSCPNRPLRY